MIDQNYAINLVPGKDLVVVHVSQYDVGRNIILNLYDGSATFRPPTGSTAVIEGTKPDKRGFSLPATIQSTAAIFETTRNMCAVPGQTRCEIRIKNGTDDIGTANFILEVEPAGLADDVDISETELPEYIDGAHDWAKRAEAWAAGTIEGSPVPASDDAYQNNSKYYAEQSALSATAAGTAATNAADSATDAAGSKADAEAWAVGKRGGQDVPSSDPAYQNNAKYYADIAQSEIPQGTTVSFRISNGHLYVQQTIGGVPRAEQDLGQVVGSVTSLSLNLTDVLTTVNDGSFAGFTVNSASAVIWGRMTHLHLDLLNSTGQDVTVYGSRYLFQIPATYTYRYQLQANGRAVVALQSVESSAGQSPSYKKFVDMQVWGSSRFFQYIASSEQDQLIVIPAGHHYILDATYINDAT